MTESDNSSLFEERHFTIHELSKMWHFSVEFVRQIVKDEPGVTEWVRQRPGKRRYRVLRVPQSVVERAGRAGPAGGGGGGLFPSTLDVGLELLLPSLHPGRVVPLGNLDRAWPIRMDT